MGKMTTSGAAHPMRHSTPSLALAAAVAFASCAKQGPEAAEGDRRSPIVERKTEEGLLEQDIDLDGDGKADIQNFYRERADAPRLLVRKELDLNHDTKMDVVSYFDLEGVLEREEMDSDYDGRFDWTDHYQKGVRVMSEYDTDYDGRPNVFKYYIRGEDGKVHLDRKERDEDGDGKIDVWERFGPTGEVIRTGRDTNSDGKVDVREE
jgi:hypothetical protein